MTSSPSLRFKLQQSSSLLHEGSFHGIRTETALQKRHELDSNRIVIGVNAKNDDKGDEQGESAHEIEIRQ